MPEIFREFVAKTLLLASPFFLTAGIIGFHCNQPEPEKPVTLSDVLKGCK